MERCDGYQGGVWRFWRGETVDRKCDSHRRDVKGIRALCQLTERCDGYRDE